jgi:hypothetical protein
LTVPHHADGCHTILYRLETWRDRKSLRHSAPDFSFFSQNTTRQAFGHRTATFAEDTLVNNQLRDYWGEPTIREWAKRDIIGERLTMNVTKVIKHCGNFTVSAKYTQLGGDVLRGYRRV